jgi:hypothetical protein
MSERDPNRILLDDTDIITAFDIWFEGERKIRNFGVNRDEQAGFIQGLALANAIIKTRLERQKNDV